MFVFPDPEPPIIKILYRCSGIYDHFSLCCLLFSFLLSLRFLKKVKSYLKPVPFKIYADFESILENLKSYERIYSKKYQDHIPYFFHL